MAEENPLRSLAVLSVKVLLVVSMIEHRARKDRWGVSGASFAECLKGILCEVPFFVDRRFS